jgi:hypothetical protein
LAAIVVAAGLFTLWRERQLRRQTPTRKGRRARIDTPRDSSYTPANPNSGRDRDKGSERLKWS